MNTVGIILLVIAGLAQSSFGLGMKKQGVLPWEGFWLIYALFGMLIIPMTWGVVSFSGFFKAIFTSETKVLLDSLLLGFLWGVGGILFGKSVNLVGISITNGIVMGLAGALGTLIPLLKIDCIYDSHNFIPIIIGIIIMMFGVGLSSYAGILRDHEQNLKAGTNKFSWKLWKGIIVVIICGILSSLLNVGFEQANPIAQNAAHLGANSSACSIVSRSVVVFGGFLMNAGYAIVLLFQRKTWKAFTIKNDETRKSILWGILTSILWFLPLGLSGIVSENIGQLGNVITWPVMLSLSLIFGNIWGYIMGEWKNTKYSFLIMIAATVFLIAASFYLTFKTNF